METAFSTTDVMIVLPEILLACGAMAFLMLGAFRRTETTGLITSLCVLLLVVVAGVILFEDGSRQTAFNGGFVTDAFSKFMKLLTLVGSTVTIIMSIHFMKAERIERFEYPILVVLATLGMLMMISANDLISLYMGLELQSLALYVVAALNRDSVRSSEAGLKYFVLGALSSGMLLYGCSLVYGFTGTTAFEEIAKAATADNANLGLLFGLVFIVAGLAFKVSAVPFHMWTPDVYEGAPTPVTAFFAAAPESCRHGHVHPCRRRRVPRRDPRLATDRGVHRHRLDGAWRIRRHRTDQHQADCWPIPPSVIWVSPLSVLPPAVPKGFAAS